MSFMTIGLSNQTIETDCGAVQQWTHKSIQIMIKVLAPSVKN